MKTLYMDRLAADERLDSLYARRRLDALRGETELMKELSSKQTGLIDTGFAYEKRDWFDGVTELLREGSASGDPSMDLSRLPDPGQTSLRLRLHELAIYSLNLGVNLIGAEGELDCDGWTERQRAFGAYVKKINGDWQSWYDSRR